MTLPACSGLFKARGFAPPAPGMIFFASTSDVSAAGQSGGRSGTGQSITDSGSSAILTDSGGAFAATEIGMYVIISGAANSANNGCFLVTARTATTLTYSNPPAVTESGSIGWELLGRCSLLTDRVAGSSFVQATDANMLTVARISPNSTKYLSTSGAAARYLQLNSAALAGLLNGTVDHAGVVVRSVSISGTTDYMSFADSISTYDNSIRWRSDASDFHVYAREAGGTPTSVTGANALPTSMNTLGWSFRASDRRLALYFNGGFLENKTVGISSPSLMTLITLGFTVASGSAMFGGWTVSTVDWTTAQQLAVHNYYKAIHGY